MKKSGLVAVGELGKPHGLRGEISVGTHADSPALYEQVDKVYLNIGRGRPRAVSIEAVRPHKGRVLLKFKGIDGRDQAERWRGAVLMVRRKDLPETDPDEVYWHDLYGIEVRTTTDRVLGILSQIQAMPQEIWTITAPTGEEILFPAHPDNVEDIDLDAGRAVIDPPPGLVELYLDAEDTRSQALPTGADTERPGKNDAKAAKGKGAEKIAPKR
jgi:16S rRNA processing protein RimM